MKEWLAWEGEEFRERCVSRPGEPRGRAQAPVARIEAPAEELMVALRAPGRAAQLAALEREGRGGLRQAALGYVELAYHDKKGADSAPAVRWWKEFCARGVKGSPGRVLDVSAPLQAKLDEELVIMDYACWLVQVRGVAPATARSYVSTVQAWHERRHGVRLAGNLVLARLPAMLKGMEKAQGGKRPRRLRRGMRPRQLAQGLASCLGGGSKAEANWRAALVVAFCGLLRGKELGKGDASKSDFSKELTRADVSFGQRGGKRCACLTMRPCEKGKMGVQGKTVKVWLAGGGEFLDPVAALQELFQVDKVPREAWASTPLFREADGSAFTTSRVRAVVRGMVGKLVEKPMEFGAHSLRIGGATAAMAAGVPIHYIKAMGRWSSEIYEIYCRLSDAAVIRFGRAIASIDYVDFENEFQTEEEW